MKLYEIDAAIEELVNSIEVDDETGEVLTDLVKLAADIDALQMERKSILTYLAKTILNMRGEAAAIKAEEQRLKARRDKLAKKENYLLDLLDAECMGEKTDLEVATLSYRNITKVEVYDTKRAVDWLEKNNYSKCYRIAEPEIAKVEVRKLINSGTAVPGCTLIDNVSCSLK